MATHTFDIELLPRMSAGYLGDGATTTIALPHDRQSYDVVLTLQDASTRRPVECDWRPTAPDTVTLTFDVAPAVNAIRWMLVG